MRIFFIFGVLLNHSTTVFLHEMSSTGWEHLALLSTHLMLHFTRMGFMFMTGLVLTLSYYNRNDWPTFFKKRFAGSGWPYLLWNFFLLLAMMVFSDPHLANLSVFSQTYFDAIIHGDRFYLYYILITLQLYVIYPLIVTLFKRLYNYHNWILGISFTIQMILMFVIKYVYPHIDKTHWLWWFQSYGVNVFTYQFFFIFGTYTMLHYNDMWAFIQRHIKLIATFTIAMGLGTVLYYTWDTKVMGFSSAAALSPHQPYMLVYDTLMIIFVFWIGKCYAYWREHGIWPWFEAFIKTGATISFGIYLDQTLGLNILTRIVSYFNLPDWGFLLLIPVGYAFALAVSFLIALFCYKVPPFGIFIGRPQWHILKKNRDAAKARAARKALESK